MTTLNFRPEPFKFDSRNRDYETDHLIPDYEEELKRNHTRFDTLELEADEAEAVLGYEVQSRNAGVRDILQRHRATHTAMMQALNRMGQHIAYRGGKYHFHLSSANSLNDAASKLGLHPRVVSNLLKSLSRRNERIGPARMHTNKVGPIGELDSETNPCPGTSAVINQWWGGEFWLNECETKSLIGALTTGGAAGAGCAGLAPEGHVKVACGAAALIAGVSAGSLTAIDAAGGNRGIVVYLSPVGGSHMGVAPMSKAG